VPRWSPLRTADVEVDAGTPLAQVAEAVGVSEEEMRRLNPHLVRGATPPGSSPYEVAIPAGREERFAAEFPAVRERAVERQRLARAEAAAVARTAATRAASARAASARAATPRRHTVRQGENLSVIARRYNTSVRRIQSVNGMGSQSRIRPGQRLVIPT
jgi:membrane-bound lytic murein transglycosylase D